MSSSQRLLPPRWWWLVLAVILLCAGALRYTGYNFSLPYDDHVDEASYTLAGRMIIDFGSAKPIGMQGYPPGIVMVNYFFLRFFQDPSQPPTSILWMVRLVSITFSLLTIIALALLTFRVATPLAGLIAAGLWTFTPIIVEFSRYATADNFVTFFSIAALFLVLTGTRFNERHWIYAAIAAAIMAILFKYQSVFLLPIIVVIPLWRLTNKTISRREVLRQFAVTIGVLAIFAFWLVFLFPSLEATSSPDWSAPTSKLAIPSPTVIWANFQVVYTQLESSLLWLIGWVGLIALAWREFRRQIDGLALLVVAVSAFAWIAGVSFYGNLGSQEFRQFIAAGALFYALRSIGLIGWIFVIGWVANRVITLPQTRQIAAALVVIVTMILGVAEIQASIDNAHNHTLPDQRNALTAWADVSIPSGGYIAGAENHKTFNRDWGGYAGVTKFNLVQIAALDTKPIDQWRTENVDYAIISNYQYQTLQTTPAGQSELAQTTLLKDFPASSAFRGPDMVVLSLYPIQHSATGQLGSIRWIGYDLNKTTATAADTLQLSLYWQADAPTDATYVVFNHLIDPKTGKLVAQDDGDPLNDLRRPTSTWNDPKETLMSRPFSLSLTNVPPGTYQLITGFYRRDTGVRLVSPQGADSLTVATIQVN